MAQIIFICDDKSKLLASNSTAWPKPSQADRPEPVALCWSTDGSKDGPNTNSASYESLLLIISISKLCVDVVGAIFDASFVSSAFLTLRSRHQIGRRHSAVDR